MKEMLSKFKVDSYSSRCLYPENMAIITELLKGLRIKLIQFYTETFNMVI